MKPIQNTTITRRLRQAGGLIIAGLLVQGASIFWNHALSFILFISVGCLLFGMGGVVYLWAIVSNRTSSTEESGTQD
jgi:protein-S-isoprenylcysteine O-methyltransferase Ste14